jgi:hypothetical protein
VDAESSGVQGDAYPYSDGDRRAQLRTFADACSSASSLFSEHAAEDLARVYASLAREAERLLGDGFIDSDLRELGQSVPGRVPWMHPKYADFNASREPWQDEVADSVEAAERAALELRAVATYTL